MVSELLLPFTLPVMTKAMGIMLILSVPTALLSCFIVLKGWSLLGDAISHAILPGVVLAYITGLPLIIGAFGAGMMCALVTGFITNHSRLKRDTVMGVVFSGMFGLGIVLFAAFPNNQHLDHILFGNMLGISYSKLLVSGSISVCVCALLWVKRMDMLLMSFDPAQAQVSGLSVNALYYGLLVGICLTVVATLTAVGLILAIGLLIAPGAIAFLLTRQFKIMLPLAVFITAFSSVLGIYISFFIDSAPAATIILLLSIIFIISFVRRVVLNARMRQEPLI